MCGIAGYISYKGDANETVLSAMGHVLSHRGPDDQGVFVSPEGRLGMVHRRLSFLDLSEAGRQPMCTADGRYAVTYNGEIYNYRELRTELEAQGFIFKTRTDTEVLLHGFAAWGRALPSKLKGMFAFAVYDSQTQKLFLARDRFGIKPLFITHTSTHFLFASELKGILAFPGFRRQINKRAVSLFLANRYVPAPDTIWENVFKLKPAHWLEVDVTAGTRVEGTYWELAVDDQKKPMAESQQKIATLLKNSLDIHLRSDVQVGAFLSGGMDSSALVLLMRELKYTPRDAFSIGFNGWEESEHRYAQEVADATDTNLHTLLLDRISMDTVSQLMYHYDDPIADISILPTYAVSGLAVQTTKAVVSGEGADECFGGYWWQQPERFSYANRWKKWMAKFRGTSFADIKQHYIDAMSMGLFDAQELHRALTPEWQGSIPDDPFVHFDQYQKKGISVLKQIQYLDMHTFMPELILNKVDRASMAHSLEVRVPFLDHELVEYAFSLSPTAYFVPGTQKAVIRKILEGKVPSNIYARKKQGFVGPDRFYMDLEVYRSSLSACRLVTEGVIRAEYIEDALTQGQHWKLWKLFVLEHWWRNWM